MNWCGLFVATIAATALAVPASASLIGDTVDSEITPGAIWASVPPQAVVVEGAPEFELQLVGRTFFEVNVEDSWFVLDYVAAGGLSMGAGERYVLSDLDWVDEPGEIIGFELTLSGNINGIDETDVTFTPDSVTINLNQSQWQPGPETFMRIDLIVTHPAPGTLALFGVMGLMGRGRKRRA